MGKFKGFEYDDLILNSEPKKEELLAIEEELLNENFENEDLEKIVYDVKNEIGSCIENGGITWCEATAYLDGSTSTEYSKLDNADELGNTASPYNFFQENYKNY